MTIELKIASKSDAEEWDRIVDESPHGTIFHTWKWLEIVKKYTNFKLYPIIGYKGTTPIGIFPLFYQRRALLRMLFSPPPHTAIPYLGPVLVNYNKLKQNKKETNFVEFQNEVDKFINEELKANYISISLPPTLLDSRPFKWLGYKVGVAYDYIISLDKGIDYVWQQFERKLRGDINRAIKRGIYVEEGSKYELEIIYDLMVKRYAEQNKIVTVPKDYLLELYDIFNNNLKIFVAKRNGEILTGAIDIYYKDMIINWIGSPKPRIEISPSPNDLLGWEGIKYGYKHGLRYYGVVGAAGNERLRGYYSKYNPDLLVRFCAKKTSFTSKWLETSYVKILKPLSAKMRLLGRGQSYKKNK